MEIVESYLLKNGFTKVNRLVSLKVTAKSRNDKRFYLADGSFGLHISEAGFAEKMWLQFIEGIGHDKIRQLNVLYLARNEFNDFEINDFPNLIFLNIAQNGRLMRLHIQNTPQLKAIYASRCASLNSFTMSGRFEQLEQLEIYGGQLYKLQLPPLPRLRYLHFADNQISDLSPIASHLLTPGLLFFLHSNPLVNPPMQTVRRGNEAVINWLEDLVKQGEEVVYEAKLMIIGDAGSGKTSLTRKIQNYNAVLPESDETTVGIEISPFVFESKGKPNFRVNIWDLGGQKRYHPLHQLFFSRRSMYVLVSDGRVENDLEDFWVPAQELLGKDSPMLILFNQRGTIQPSIPFHDLATRYPNIRGKLWTVNLKQDPEKTEEFAKEIEKNIRSLPQFEKGKEEKLPKLWAHLREAIGAKSEQFIGLSDFRRLCSDVGISDENKQDFVSDYLHDLGIILRFRDNGLLNKTVFLQPQWALDAIYKILDHTREHKNGLFTRIELLRVWQDKISIDIHDELLALMEKFELCYQIASSTEQYLVPSLLPEDLPKKFHWDKTGNTILYYSYEFMPKGIISRLIVRLNKYIAKDQLLWREGVIIEYHGATAWLTKNNKRIEIYAKGYRPSAIITLITNEIDDINDKYYFSERSKLTKYVPCICKTCKISDTPNYYLYDDLLSRDKYNKESIECNKQPFHTVSVKQLLENVEDNQLKTSFKMAQEIEVRPIIKVNPEIEVSPKIKVNPEIDVTTSPHAEQKKEAKSEDRHAEDKAIKKWKMASIWWALGATAITAVLIYLYQGEFAFVMTKEEWLEFKQSSNDALVKFMISGIWGSFILRMLYDRFSDSSKEKAKRDLEKQKQKG